MKMQPLPTRRDFIKAGGYVIAGLACGARPLAALAKAKPAVQFGVLTDVHYADRKNGGSRYYRESLGKIKVAVQAFNKAGVDFTVQCGDFIDSGDGSVESELANLKTIEQEYAKLDRARYYVLGNHCVNLLTKQEFADHSGMDEPYHSFDQGGWHFLVLDACFNSKGQAYERKNFKWTDANIPDKQVDWLEADLRKNNKPTIVFVHQHLGGGKGSYLIRNSEKVREVLEASGKVAAVFQGHSHKNTDTVINGIHYCVVRAMVEGSGAESSGFGLVKAYADGSIRVQGALEQSDYNWGR